MRKHKHRRRKGSVVGGHHGKCEAPAYNGGLGAELPARSRGRAPGQGGEAPPPEAESILVIGCPTEPGNLAPFQKCFFEQYALLQSTGVRVGRAQSAWCPPNPVIGGGARLCPPAALLMNTRAVQVEGVITFPMISLMLPPPQSTPTGRFKVNRLQLQVTNPTSARASLCPIPHIIGSLQC